MPLLRILLAVLAVLPFRLAAQDYEGRQLVRADLIADTTAVVPGIPFTVGLRLEMAPGWHTYWEYSGDAGLSTRIQWTLPKGFSAGPIQWPIPEKLVESGDLVTYGYSDEVLLLVEITPPNEVSADTVTLKAEASWLVCEEICIPGDARDLAVTLPVAADAAPAEPELFGKYRARLPTGNVPYALAWTIVASGATLEVSGVPEDAKFDFFPLPGKDMQIGHATVADGSSPNSRTIKIPIIQKASDDSPLEGVLVRLAADGHHAEDGWLVSSSHAAAPASAAFVTPMIPQEQSLLKILFLGFVGGLILNVMPCVLPVITLKLLGFIKQAGESPAKIFRIGLTFTAGIFAWFLVMATIAAILRAGGGQLNWAFQFQSPYYLIGIASVLFVFGLNLMGVFEIVLPGSANSRLLDLAAREGYLGAFLHGIFATLLATPCLAPYLGTAVGFAVAQPPLVIFAVFMAIAAGMSLPYVVLTIRPAWMRFLPRPGIWMERVKQAMGFLLMATVLLVLWVLGRQRGADGVVWVSGFLLCLAIAAWIFGAFAGPMASGRSRFLSIVTILLVLGGGFKYFIRTQFAATPLLTDQDRREEGGIAWQEFSHAALEEAVRDGRTVFLDFTADWCLNCKANERLILETDSVRAAFKQYDVVAMKADWTNGDPEITRMLRTFGRAGVPTYAVYRNGSATPELLPELLTKSLVIEAVRGRATTE